jgi:hypothetical protein
MKPESSSSPKDGSNRRKSPSNISHLPMEWMDPMSWRLPSGKALAEFALQAGFVAPLILSGPRVKRKVPAQAGVRPAPPPLETKEAPERTGTFRQTR